jgi:hypothetical protein
MEVAYLVTIGRYETHSWKPARKSAKVTPLRNAE